MQKKMAKRLEDYQLSKPEQLVLFEFLSPEDKRYSNTIEFYDFIPKYYWGKMKRVNGQFLPDLERDFECKGVRYKLVVSPASIKTKDGTRMQFYPGEREEIVEDALRKLVCEKQGVFLDDQASVVFSLYELQNELERIGHKYSYDQIKESLSICVGTTLEVTTEDGAAVFKSHIFETIGLQTIDDWRGKGQKTKCFVRFNPLVTASIKNKTFRQINYEKCMSYRSVIARQLYKRMSHHYKQAGLTNPYTILLSTVIRDLGLTLYKKLPDNLRDVLLALEEMKEKDVIVDCVTEKIIESTQHNKLIDAKITITPHPKFTSEIIKANKKQKEIQE